jgi:hypothetical protein
MTPKVLSARRRGATGGGRLGRAVLVFGIGAAAWPFIYVTLSRLLRTLRGVEEVGPLLASKLLALGLLVFFGILLLSNLIGALSSFFLSRDLSWVRSAPVDWLAVYLSRLTETLVSSSWMVVLMLVPILAAYERVYDGGWPFLALSVFAVVPFLVIPAAIGSAITLILVRVFPARRSKDILGVMAIAAAALVVLLLRILRPERLVSPEAYRNLVDFLAVLRGPSSPWLPSQWGADVPPRPPVDDGGRHDHLGRAAAPEPLPDMLHPGPGGDRKPDHEPRRLAVVGEGVARRSAAATPPDSEGRADLLPRHHPVVAADHSRRARRGVRLQHPHPAAGVG